MTTDAPQAEMPRYKCHKEVWALKIAELKWHDSEGNRIPGGAAWLTPADAGFAPFLTPVGFEQKCKPVAADLGYYVVYQDGYTSWSPTKAFEEGYTRL